jgi:jumonji domain-containing protein 2
MYISLINRHKGIALMPQLLKACDPPIPFHCIKQGKGDYVITFPGAFHFVVNAGANVAEATNFAIPEWVPFAGKAGKCTCDHNKKVQAVQIHFKKM